MQIHTDEYLQIIAQELSDKNKGEAMTLAERFEQRGEQRGQQRGEQLGLRKARVEMAISMLQEALPLPTIVRVTGLPLNKIERLKRAAIQTAAPEK